MNSTFGLLRQFISLQSRCRPLCCSSLYLNTTVAAVAVTGVDGGEIGGVDERAAAGGLKKYQNRRRLELASQYNRWLSPLLLYNRGYASDSGALNMSELTDLINSIVNRGARRGRTQDVAANEVVSLFCSRYKQLTERGKEHLLLNLARDFAPTPDDVTAAVHRYTVATSNNTRPDEKEGGFAGQNVRAYEKLRKELRPAYETLFRKIVAASDDGVRFVVDLRQDTLNLMRTGHGDRNVGNAGSADLGALDASLRSLLQGWFSVGFLELRRITYEDSGGALLEKITRYEAVHPVRSLSELKHRLGQGRRCFAFFHPCLSDEPLVFVYVALLSEMAGSMEQIRKGRGGDGTREDGKKEGREDEAQCAVFYSISSTQKGLRGVQLGNFLIKRVVAQLRAELPQLDSFATLSPIPSFRDWLTKKATHRLALVSGGQSELSGEPLLTPEEANAILSTKSPDAFAGNSNTAAAEAATVAAGKEGCRREAEALAVLLAEDGPLLAGPISGDGDGDASSGIKKKATEAALTRLAARYLVRETVRGKIPDPVGNFHISNGARLERVNWMADRSPKGIRESFGLMVNYLYDPYKIESNNRLYLSRGEVRASDDVRELAWSLRNQKMKKTGHGRSPAGFL